MVGPADVHKRVRELVAGDTLTLTKGNYEKPIVLSSIAGTEKQPIVINGADALLGPRVKFKDFREVGNKLAAAHEAGGRFPGLYYLADNGILILKNCQWVTIEDLHFEGCWPTAVYLENCQHITLRGLKITGGTFAIGATGINTRHILVECCDWVQDPSGNGWEICKAIRSNGTIERDLEGQASQLWRDIDWEQVHGERNGPDNLVDVEDDARAYDGDFFRAWDIAGYVVIRNNVIADAFNGIHFFNQTAESIVDSCSRNVLIENNWFVRIRDNAIEPEHFAWNWTIRHNTIVDCYMPFSLEMARSGFFYIYGNIGWNSRRPGPPKDTHTRGQLFKFPSEHTADGPHYVFNNSWILRAPIAKKKRFSNFVHVNNAVDYFETDPTVTVPFGENFADIAPPGFEAEKTLDFEGEHFTRQWPYLSIKFDGDTIHHHSFPAKLRAAGFPVDIASSGRSPGFKSFVAGCPEGLKTAEPIRALSLKVKLPNDREVPAVDEDIHQVGAWQSEGRFTLEDPMFWTYWPGQKTVQSTDCAEPAGEREIS